MYVFMFNIGRIFIFFNLYVETYLTSSYFFFIWIRETVGLLCGVYLLFGMISFFVSSEEKKLHQNGLFGSDRPC